MHRLNYRVEAEGLARATAAADAPVPHGLVRPALACLDAAPSDPLAALRRLVRTAALPATADAESVAHALWMRADALQHWRRHHPEDGPNIDLLMQGGPLGDPLAACLAAAAMRVESGRRPHFAPAFAAALRQAVAAAGHSPVLQVMPYEAGEMRLGGVSIAALVLCDTANSAPRERWLLDALAQLGVGDPFTDLRIGRRERLVEALAVHLAAGRMGHAADWSARTPEDRSLALLVHLAALQAVAEDDRSGDTARERARTAPLIPAADGLRFATGAALEGAPDGYVLQPTLPPALPRGFAERLAADGARPAGPALAAEGIDVPPEMAAETLADFVLRARISLARLRRSQARQVWEAFGWPLDTATLDDAETVQHGDLVGFLGSRPVFAYAAATAPFDSADPVLQNAVTGLGARPGGAAPILMSLQPAFQVQEAAGPGGTDRVIVQGGWQFDGIWRPFALGPDPARSLSGGLSALPGDRLPAAAFRRLGRDAGALEALATLARLRHAALDPEVDGGPAVNGALYRLGLSGGWAIMAEEPLRALMSAIGRLV